MTASIRDGVRLAARHPRLVCLLWAWYGLLALVPALPAWRWWNGVLGTSPEAASVLTRFDLGVFLDLVSTQGVNGLGLLAGAAMAVAAIAFVSSAFAFGGILEVFGSEGEPRSFMHRFFRGGGHFFWRFFRLALIAGVCLVLATGAISALMTGATAPLRESEWEPAGYLLGMANLAVLLAVAALFLLALDYARIRVSRRRRSKHAEGVRVGPGVRAAPAHLHATASPSRSSGHWPCWSSSTWRTKPTPRRREAGERSRCCSSSSKPS